MGPEEGGNVSPGTAVQMPSAFMSVSRPDNAIAVEEARENCALPSSGAAEGDAARDIRMPYNPALGPEMVALDVDGHGDNKGDSENLANADEDPNIQKSEQASHPGEGWRKTNSDMSLAEVYGSVKWPENAPWYKKVFALLGVGLMVSVAFMDPGNWATDLQGGASYGYTLLIVIVLSNLCAIFLQALSLKVGIVAERDLAQACRDAYHKYVVYFLWVIIEAAIAATDLAEVIGSATALYLLFNIPIWAGVIVTALDTLFILSFGVKNFRFLEIIVGSLALLIAVIFGYELGIVKPDWTEVAKGLIPESKIITNNTILYTAIGILGATVMPHSLFLHSSIIQTRAYPRTKEGKKAVMRYARWDSSMSLLLALFVNAAILILSAAAFNYSPNPNKGVANITDAYRLLAPALGSRAAKILFAVGLLASGQNSTIVGTLAGQIVMEGFLKISVKPWIRRAITRGIAIVPAAIVAAVGGNSAAGELLVMSQVFLSLVLSFAVVPLVHLTNSTAKMGPAFVNGIIMKISAVIVAVIIACLNVYLLYSSIKNNEFGNTKGV